MCDGTPNLAKKDKFLQGCCSVCSCTRGLCRALEEWGKCYQVRGRCKAELQVMSLILESLRYLRDHADSPGVSPVMVSRHFTGLGSPKLCARLRSLVEVTSLDMHRGSQSFRLHIEKSLQV